MKVEPGDAQFAAGLGSKTILGPRARRPVISYASPEPILHERCVTTQSGDVDQSDLRIGDPVLTRDQGYQPIVWTGQRHLTPETLTLYPNLAPIVISKGAMGQGLPTRNLTLTPNTRILIKQDTTALYFDDNEILVVAKNLLHMPGVTQCLDQPVFYSHILTGETALLRINGIWVEHVFPNGPPATPHETRVQNEFFELHPDLKNTGDASSPAMW